MEFPKVSWGLYKDKERKVKIYLGLFTLILLIPSIFTAYQIVRTSYFKGKAEEFIRNEILIDNRRVLEKGIKYERDPSIELTIIGPKINETQEKELQNKLKYYNLTNTKLILHQDLSTTNLDNLKYEILSEIYKSNFNSDQNNTEMIAKEIQIFFPNLVSVSFTKTKKFDMNQNAYVDSNLFDSEWKKLPSAKEKTQLEKFLHLRTGEIQIELIMREVH